MKTLTPAVLLVLTLFGLPRPVQAQNCTTFCTLTLTPSFASFRGLPQIQGADAAAGDVVAAFEQETGRCVGTFTVAEVSGRPAFNLVLYGDDATTLEDDGLTPGEAYELRICEMSTGEVHVHSTAFTDFANTNGAPLPGRESIETAYNFTETLPVELTRFDALADGRAVTLRWTTASERINAGFEVEMRAPEAAWQTLAFVPGAGTTTEAQSYTHRVGDLAPGTYHFRLRQIDLDGAFAYGPEVTVEVALPEALTLSDAYPNPFNPTTTFSFTVARPGAAVVEVFDLLGRVVARPFDGAAEPGRRYEATFDATGLPSGLYLYTLRTGGETRTGRAVLLK